VADRVTTFKDRDAWIRALFADASLTQGIKSVGVRLALHLHVKTGRCNPAYVTLASEVCVTERFVYCAIEVLERAGWIEVDHTGGGRHRKNDCRLVIPKTLNTASGFSSKETLNTGSGFSPRNPEQNDTETLNAGSGVKRKEKSVKGSINGPTSGFEDFWRAYPLHKAKAAAEKAYQKIIRTKRATPEQIVEGALRYADERRGQDPQYTKHAATWLNAECWNDEPAAAAASLGPQLAKVVRALADMPDRDDGGTE
jgi:hypothetical protein